MIVAGIETNYVHGLWVGEILINWHGARPMEILLGGTREGPEQREVLVLERFLKDPLPIVDACHRKLGWKRILHRPVRVAINNENRIGIQFQNMFTMRQPMVLE